MAHKRNEETAKHDNERAAKTALALQGLSDGTYSSVGQAARTVGLSKSTLRRRMKGGKTRAEARESQQQLTCQQEKALVDWISHATVSSNPVPHQYIKQMAEEIRSSRTEEGTSLRPLGTTWMEAFLGRHPQLATKLTKAIEAARVKDVNREQVLAFNDEFRKVIHEKNIKLHNIYNSDETGIKFD